MKIIYRHRRKGGCLVGRNLPEAGCETTIIRKIYQYLFLSLYLFFHHYLILRSFGSKTTKLNSCEYQPTIPSIFAITCSGFISLKQA